VNVRHTFRRPQSAQLVCGLRTGQNGIRVAVSILSMEQTPVSGTLALGSQVA